ncbi:ABC transporter permease [Streptomonospora nanhaiensis]|uniref:ABC-type nitrate/sulfonate/bicarbonate transport system permease component n=1 Tax=Streptomonospora nanhaiensis TaxID=1323731 RepID=A0A853BJA4_9ACTN|nr:ABC transporter permease [Streptomonospora nanhaiensis]MBV2362986.1 ABC transporter permease [Streptomonospora nanhaiensis]NYI95353.1 ABC-type nitrate/sulfonate/bicarbonate transport system permease component [Streptomonospora nanhaiensis]
MSTDIADPARPSAAAAAEGGPPAPKRAPNRLLLGAAGVAAFLLLWEAVPRLGIIPGRFLPPATEVLATLGERVLLPEFWIAVLDTLIAWGLGLAIAFAAAVVLGFVVGAVPALRRFTSSTVEFLRPIPSVALIPLAILLYGTDLASTLMLVIYAAFWQIYIQVLYGVGDIDPVAEQTARSYGLGRFARLRYVAWPSALPYLMTGLRLGASVALILAVTGQLIIGTPGLGEQIAVAQASGATALVYALIIATGALGVAVNVGLRALERRALRWHVSVRGEENA